MFKLVYADGDGGDAAAAAAEAEAAAAAAAAAAVPPSGGDDPFTKLKFTSEQQKFVNEQMAKERRKLQQQNEKTIEELRKLQQQQGTTTKQRDDLQTRINELQQQYMSKEEIAKQERERQEREYQNALQGSRGETEHWKRLFQGSTITRALQDGAIDAEAYSPGQIIDILGPRTRLVEEVDSEGKATGRFSPRVKLEETDNEGKTTELDLTVKEALSRMKQQPDRFGNLFKSGVAGGLGANGSAPGTRKRLDPKKMTPDEWAAARKKDPNFGFVGGS